MERTRSIDNVLQARDISKTFVTDRETTHVVEKFDIEVKKNEFVVLFGPGQCGKTTILKILAGLEKPSTGEILLNNQKVTEPGPARGYVFQSLAIFPWLTVMGNVEYGLKVRGVSKAERRERAQHYINLVGLEGFENHYPVKISGGMKQRVGIARAYCNEPDVLLMDEPFGALDAQTRYLMQDEITRIWEKEKRTVIFVTNNIEEAVYLADRIVLLKNCPTSIDNEYIIDLPRPRSNVDPKFLTIRQEITEVMDKTL
ncbi:MAG: ABC transporter ATP-binding protein [Clostridiaceae bacterium]|jgi:NitT/TauT family transport system ATP-binding protein/sulfonate transport system ATP-binding protein|nr:ABC transporter ATP-binding protein [Clostridiaceae bacterium]